MSHYRMPLRGSWDRILELTVTSEIIVSNSLMSLARLSPHVALWKISIITTLYFLLESVQITTKRDFSVPTICALPRSLNIPFLSPYQFYPILTNIFLNGEARVWRENWGGEGSQAHHCAATFPNLLRKQIRRHKQTSLHMQNWCLCNVN